MKIITIFTTNSGSSSDSNEKAPIESKFKINHRTPLHEQRHKSHSVQDCRKQTIVLSK